MIKQIDSFKNYFVSDTGKVFSNAKCKNMFELKQHIKPDGYLSVTLYDKKRRKTFLVHRLVAEAFILNPKNKPTVNHIDGNKQNNNVNNLEWATFSEQEVHSFTNGLNYARKGEGANRAELTWDIVHYIRNHYPEISVSELSSMFNTTKENIYAILYNYNWVEDNYVKIKNGKRGYYR